MRSTEQETIARRARAYSAENSLDSKSLSGMGHPLIMSDVYFGETDFDFGLKIAARRREERERAAELARKKRNK